MSWQLVTGEPLVIAKSNGATGIGSVISNVKKVKELSTTQCLWRTDYSLLKEGETVISRLYEVNEPLSSKWQFEINPNFVDEQGTRFLSFKIKLVEPLVDDDQIMVACNVMLMTDGEGQNYNRDTGLAYFSRRVPMYGFNRYIEHYRVNSPQGNPTQELKFLVTLTIFKEREKIAPAPRSSSSSSGSTGCNEWANNSVDCDSQVLFQGEAYPVNSERLSQHSEAFSAYYRMADSDKRPMDLSQICQTKSMFIHVITFCLTGELKGSGGSGVKRPKALLNLMEVATLLGIPTLHETCQTMLLEYVNVDSFMEMMELVSKGTLNEATAMPVLVKFLVRNRLDMGQNEHFKQNYQNLKPLLKKYMFEENTSGMG